MGRNVLNCVRKATLLCGLFRNGALQVARQKQHAYEMIDWVVNVLKKDDPYDKSRQRQAISAQPVQISLRRLFAHEQQNQLCCRREAKTAEG